jgi:hypothetical protein
MKPEFHDFNGPSVNTVEEAGYHTRVRSCAHMSWSTARGRESPGVCQPGEMNSIILAHR